jgi:hypothetical protein
MKKIATTLLVLISGFIAHSQAYKGEGDLKFQIGSNLQKGAAGLSSSIDYGIGENMSVGAQASFILNNTKYEGFDGPKVLDKADVKVRFNANLGNVLKLDSKMDIYPGLNIGLRNLGLHGGFRYFFTDGFGLYAEAGFPIASFDDRDGYKRFNNQFVGNIGFSFNL